MRFFWFATVLLLPACSLFVDFDRSLIPREGTIEDGSVDGRTENRAPDGGKPVHHDAGPRDASKDAASEPVDLDGGAPDADARPPPIACTVGTNQGCAPDELCCGATGSVACKKTTLASCEECGVACAGNLALACSGRSCECVPGSGKPCTGTGSELFCVGANGTASCVECQDATDCASRADGKHECVAGACVQCDPKGRTAGCAATTPICDPNTDTCTACSATPDDCATPLLCTPSGACGGCAKSATDCTSPTSPICDGASTECRACATNAECQAALGKPYCIGASRCSACLPTTEAGCADPTKPDCRLDANGGYSCQACTTNANCLNVASGKVCDSSTGRCAECAVDTDGKTAGKPFCDNDVCVACDTSALAFLLANARCASLSSSSPVCATSGTKKGQCAACDPSDSGGCSTSSLCCETAGVPGCVATSVGSCASCGAACNPALANACTNRGCKCGNGSPCAGTGTARFCLGNPGSCVECGADSDCTTLAAPLCDGNKCVACTASGVTSGTARCASKLGGAGACASSGSKAGQCAACDPTDHEGCTTNQLCCETSGVPGCQATSASQCAACGTACDGTLSDSCSGRQCKCGTAAECTGSGASTYCTGTPSSCAACRTDADCGGGTPLCAGGACLPCVGVTGAAARCAAVLGGKGTCAESGAQSGFCTECDPTTNAGCSGKLDQCDAATATCVDCDGNGGCGDVPNTPVCQNEACRKCATDDECNTLTSGAAPLCTAAGACAADVSCAASSNCSDANHGVCVMLGTDAAPDRRCRACDPATNDGCAPTKTCSGAFTCGP